MRDEAVAKVVEGLDTVAVARGGPAETMVALADTLRQREMLSTQAQIADRH